jgi:hypothetical protein
MLRLYCCQQCHDVISADGQLFHRFHDGEAAVAGNLDDYAFLIQGLIDTHEQARGSLTIQASLDLKMS